MPTPPRQGTEQFSKGEELISCPFHLKAKAETCKQGCTRGQTQCRQYELKDEHIPTHIKHIAIPSTSFILQAVSGANKLNGFSEVFLLL